MSMTESEIKEEIKELRRKAKIFEDSGYATVGISSSFKNSADIIENLFEEIQQYRAIGTVEDIKKVISFLSSDSDNSIIDDLNLLNEYRFIGTVSEFRELKEKATAKKPTDVRYFAEAGYSIGLCPTCNSGINSEFKYCGDCCQCLDWSEGKE